MDSYFSLFSYLQTSFFPTQFTSCLFFISPKKKLFNNCQSINREEVSLLSLHPANNDSLFEKKN